MLPRDDARPKYYTYTPPKEEFWEEWDYVPKIVKGFYKTKREILIDNLKTIRREISSEAESTD